MTAMKIFVGFVIIVILLVFSQLISAIHNGGASARTNVVMSNPLSEEASATFDEFMRSEVLADCRSTSDDGVCVLWRVEDSVSVRLEEYDETTWILVRSTPRYKFPFGSPAYGQIHLQVEGSILRYFGDLVASTERYFR